MHHTNMLAYNRMIKINIKAGYIRKKAPNFRRSLTQALKIILHTSNFLRDIKADQINIPVRRKNAVSSMRVIPDISLSHLRDITRAPHCPAHNDQLFHMCRYIWVYI